MSNKLCFRVRSPELVAVAPGAAARRARASAEEGDVAHIPAAVPVAGLLLELQTKVHFKGFQSQRRPLLGPYPGYYPDTKVIWDGRVG